MNIIVWAVNPFYEWYEADTFEVSSLAAFNEAVVMWQALPDCPAAVKFKTSDGALLASIQYRTVHYAEGAHTYIAEECGLDDLYLD